MRIGLTYDLRDEYLAMGYSPEQTAEFDKEETVVGIEAALRRFGHLPERIGHARALIRRLESGERWDLVFNICEGLHGVAREAQVPAILELYDVPYVFSDPLVLALTLHKGMTKSVVRDAGVPTADFLVYADRQDLDDLTFAPPYFVKPVAEGTGKGCSARSIVRDKIHLVDVCTDLVTRFQQPAIVEPYLTGREFTVGITGTGRHSEIVGTMEIVLLANAENGVYSFDNKDNYADRVVYQPCDPVTDLEVAGAEQVARAAWRALGCRDGGRVDIRCDSARNPLFLEVNPLAGLNPQDSDLSILARMTGLGYDGLIRRILDSAVARMPSPQHQARP